MPDWASSRREDVRLQKEEACAETGELLPTLCGRKIQKDVGKQLLEELVIVHGPSYPETRQLNENKTCSMLSYAQWVNQTVALY
jgi:hypothetical protein